MFSNGSQNVNSELVGYVESHGTGLEYAFSKSIQGARDVAVNLERFEGSRAYANPDRLVSAVVKEQHNLAAAIQREGGCRISEANHITQGQFRGLREDRYTGELKGWVSVEGKGGKEREIGVSPGTFARLEGLLPTDSGSSSIRTFIVRI